MSDDDTLGRALDAALGPSTVGPIVVVHRDRRVQVEVVEPGAIGVRIRSVRVDGPIGPVVERAAAAARGTRGLGAPLDPIEVDPGLGGAILRSPPDAGEFFELTIGPGDATVTRQRASPEGGRDAVPFDLTRRDLGRLVDSLP